MIQTTKNYAKVLFDLGVAREPVQKALEIFKGSDDLIKTLDCPVVSMEKKLVVIDKIFPIEEFSKVFIHFLKQVCKNYKINNIVDILTEFDRLYQEDKGIIVATFYYVSMPDEQQIEEIKNYLCRRYQAKRAEMIFEKDETLIGGFLIRVKNTEFDYSMRARLKRLKQKLTWR